MTLGLMIVILKYTSDLYMQVVDGVMVDSISCTPSSEFSGSQLTGSISSACSRSTTEVLYSHNGSSSNPAVGDTVSVFGGSTVSNGLSILVLVHYKQIVMV